MKRIIVLSLGLLFLINQSLLSQEYKPKDLKKIHSFLIELKKAAVKKDTNKLKQLVYSIQINEKENTQTYIIDKIILNDEDSYGDFSFSIRAFNQITDSLYTKFTPISDEILAKLIEMPPFNSALIGLDNEKIPLFDYKGVHILLVESRGKNIKLLFWESLNYLLGKQTHAVIESIEEE